MTAANTWKLIYTYASALELFHDFIENINWYDGRVLFCRIQMICRAASENKNLLIFIPGKEIDETKRSWFLCPEKKLREARGARVINKDQSHHYTFSRPKSGRSHPRSPGN